MVIPHYMGRSREIDVEKNRAEENQNDLNRQNSFSSLSPLQDIPLLLPQESDGLLESKLEQTLNVNGLHENHNLFDQPNGNCGDSLFSYRNQEVEALVTDTDLQSEMFLDMEAEAQSESAKSDEWWEDPEETKKRDAADDDCGQIGPRTTCRCQVHDASMNPFQNFNKFVILVVFFL